jgi:hypothetical protein
VPVAAQIDPSRGWGVWEGTYEVRQQRGPSTAGSIVLRISKVKNGKVHMRSETMGARANPAIEDVSNLTPTGYCTPPAGHTRTTVVEGDGRRLTSMTSTGPLTANLAKKK